MKSRVPGGVFVANAGAVVAVVVVGLTIVAGTVGVLSSDDSYDFLTVVWLVFAGCGVGLLVWLVSITVVLLNSIEINTRVLAQGDVLVSDEEDDEGEAEEE
jgi:hypothetical protein